MPGPVVVVGDVMRDIIAVPEGPIAIGSDRRASISEHPGGAAANQAVWLAHFGVPVMLAARVAAHDIAGYEAQFAKLHVEARLAGDPERPTGALITLVDKSGERSFLTDRGANLNLCAADLPPSLLEGASMLVVSGYSLFEAGPRQAVLGFMDAARLAGVPMAVDPATVTFLREFGPQAFIEATRGVAIISPNEEEAEVLTGKTNPEAQAEVLAAHYPTVLIKLGPDGALARLEDGRVFRMPSPDVEVIDTTGAGDAFLARFIAARLAGESDDRALALAVTAGAYAVMRIGAQPPHR
ncbi:carbohydrate kinase family protein [Cucumibacter marinus]|uniref:carbohydrate kinase family protein n=1 Tax=Cucumibacter marinus TaxID=1121252 RepID=UPI000427B5F9|nr:sugar kinase [Cucumibacter marinus]